MSDDTREASPRSWLGRLSQLLQGDLKDREDLSDQLQEALELKLIDSDDLHMLQGVLSVSELRVRDIMIPRSQMVMLSRDSSLAEILPVLVDTAHSRYPVYGEDKDDLIGILLAKDLLPLLLSADKFCLKDLIRPAFVVPESKRLNVLLKEFRQHRNHLALVVDEYGGVAGLVTIEDILEEIVGEIDDEYDEYEDKTPIREKADGLYQLSALTPIAEFNQYFDVEFSTTEVDTLGGLLTQHLGHVPLVGESIELEGFEFRILSANKRRLDQLELRRADPAP